MNNDFDLMALITGTAELPPDIAARFELGDIADDCSDSLRSVLSQRHDAIVADVRASFRGKANEREVKRLVSNQCRREGLNRPEVYELINALDNFASMMRKPIQK